MSLKNQSIMSFFSSGAANKKAKPVDADDKNDSTTKTESKEVKKTTTAAETSKIDSASDFDDSPVKSRNVSMNESVARKRKLILESDESGPDAAQEATKKTQKKSSPTPKKSVSAATKTKENNKENEAASPAAKTTTAKNPLRLSSSEDEVTIDDDDVIVEKEKETTTKKTRGRKMGSTNKKETDSPKVTAKKEKPEKTESTKSASKKERSESPEPEAKKEKKSEKAEKAESTKSASKKERSESPEPEAKKEKKSEKVESTKSASKKERSESPEPEAKKEKKYEKAESTKSKKERSASPEPSEAKKSPVSSPKKEKKSPKRETSPVETKKSPVKKVESPEKPKETKPISNFFSKSTSVFANGKKVGSGEAIKSDAASKAGDSVKSGVYSPNKEDYHPIKDATWEKNQAVPYQALAQTLYCMERTTKRLELLAIVSNYFRSLIALSPKDLVPSIFLLTNKVAPDYENIELGIGDTVLFKALAEATGCTVAKLKTEFQSKGDIGLVAEANRCTQKLLFTPKKLTVASVFTKLKEIASISGNSSQTKKCDLIKTLLVSCDAIEARYLMRSLAGKLRNGLGELSILTGLGQAFATTVVEGDEVTVDKFKKMRKNEQIDDIKKALEEPIQKVKQAYYQCPNYDVLIDSLVKHGPYEIDEHCKIVSGIPLKPMLAYPTKGIHEVLKRFDQVELTCEYKYDGERAQIHILEDGSIKIYSRNSENNTSKYPDIIDFLKEHLKLNDSATKKKEKSNDDVKEVTAAVDDEKESTGNERKVISAIIDAEVVAYDTEKHIIQPFQKLTTRKRKDANSEDIKVQVCIFAFDLIFLNGKSLINLPLRKRRDQLYKYFPRADAKLMYAERIDTRSSEIIQEFLDKSIKDGCEGLMIKTLDDDAHYEISKRSHNWLKLKKDYLEGVGDTLDLVVLGGYHGSGKRTGVYGGYLLACYDKENEEYQTICKLGVGLKDNDLQTLFEELSKIKIDKPKAYYRVNKELEQPDVWFEAESVWEIKCADFSLSPVHTAACGMIDPEKGVSMRFPRFLRVRDDKKPEDATNSEQVVDMYKNQQQMINQTDKGSKSDNEDELD